MQQICYHWNASWMISAWASFYGIHQSIRVLGDSRWRCDPVVVVGHLCVNPWFVFPGTALAPAHHSEQKHPTCHFTHQRASRVTLWGEDASVSHSLSNVHTHAHTHYSSPCRNQYSSRGSQHRTCSEWWHSHSITSFYSHSGRWDVTQSVLGAVNIPSLQKAQRQL